jgi:hypothetical protein
MNKEKILCAATWYKDFPKQIHGPKNIEEGVVICGKSHAQIYTALNSLTGKRECSNAIDGCGPFMQGFLTTENRFVDRKEAWLIAYENKQITEDSTSNVVLYSEFIKY